MTRQATIRQRPVYTDNNRINECGINENRANENRLSDDMHPVLRRILLARGITRPEELALDLRTMLPP